MCLVFLQVVFTHFNWTFLNLLWKRYNLEKDLGADILMCQVALWGLGKSNSVMPYSPFSLLRSLLYHDSLQKLWGMLVWLKIFFPESQVILLLKSHCWALLHLLWVLLVKMMILWEGAEKKYLAVSLRKKQTNKQMHLTSQWLCSVDLWK